MSDVRRRRARPCANRARGAARAALAPVEQEQWWQSAREEGLRVPRRSRKRARTGASTAPEGRLEAQRPGQVWAFDFQFDQTADGRVLKLLNVVDELTREALAMHVDRSISADQAVAVLEQLVAERGAPEHLRCDNGPEMTAHALIDWCRQARVTTRYIDPGAPWQNGYVSPSTPAYATSS